MEVPYRCVFRLVNGRNVSPWSVRNDKFFVGEDLK